MEKLIIFQVINYVMILGRTGELLSQAGNGEIGLERTDYNRLLSSEWQFAESGVRSAVDGTLMDLP